MKNRIRLIPAVFLLSLLITACTNEAWKKGSLDGSDKEKCKKAVKARYMLMIAQANESCSKLQNNSNCYITTNSGIQNLYIMYTTGIKSSCE